MTDRGAFDAHVYDVIRPGIQRSAAFLVPRLDHWIHDHGHTVSSVVDVGCGEGWWARTWLDTACAKRVVGVDGPDGGQAFAGLSKALADYHEKDLRELGWWQGLGRHDLAVCLEVAEHLPDAAPVALIKGLVALAPVVVFSAAVPGQPGYGHVSCRWQDEWSAEFRRCGYRTAAGPFRDEATWRDPDVEWWYSQNGFVAWRGGILSHPDEYVPSCIHPRFWEVR